MCYALRKTYLPDDLGSSIRCLIWEVKLCIKEYTLSQVFTGFLIRCIDLIREMLPDGVSYKWIKYIFCIYLCTTVQGNNIQNWRIIPYHKLRWPHHVIIRLRMKQKPQNFMLKKLNLSYHDIIFRENMAEVLLLTVPFYSNLHQQFVDSIWTHVVLTIDIYLHVITLRLYHYNNPFFQLRYLEVCEEWDKIAGSLAKELVLLNTMLIPL